VKEEREKVKEKSRFSVFYLSSFAFSPSLAAAIASSGVS
jgi:hypothetical protein